MMKYAILFAALFVSTLALPVFPFIGGYQYPNNFDQDDGVVQGQQGVGAQNERGDTPDDGPGIAPQAGTTMAPEADSSSSEETSSEEETDAGTDGALTTAAPAQPVVPVNPNVAPQAGPDAGAGQAGQSSDSNTNLISQVDAAPIGAGNPDPGNTSGQQNAALNMQPQEQKEQESRQSSAAIAVTTMILVAGVAATAAVTYKYKDAIKDRVGL